MKEIRYLVFLFVFAFVVLASNLMYLQVFAASKIAAHPRNTRGIEEELSVERGQIVTADGYVLTKSKRVEQDRRFRRIYPYGALFSHLTGYYSLRYGRAGLERAFNDYLLGQREVFSIKDYLAQITKNRQQGYTLVLAVDYHLQKAASEALGNQKGAIIVLDPRTGDVLALVSHPSYDPNLLASFDLNKLSQAWESLSQNPSRPFLNRATQEWYPPGSTFKLVTASAAIENRVAEPTTKFTCTGKLRLPQTKHVIKDFGGKSHGEIDLARAFEVSCNNTFGQIGLLLGAGGLVEQAQKFGLNKNVPFELPIIKSEIPSPKEISPPEVAMAAIGQGGVRLTPFQMALITSAIANRGSIMRPRLVKEVRFFEGKTMRQFESQKWLQALSPETAATVTGLMIKVVNSGTGKNARISDVQVAGKTGTAQASKGPPHAWFACFAPADSPEIVVTVVVEGGGELGEEATGGQVAAPIAKRVLEAALKEKVLVK